MKEKKLNDNEELIIKVIDPYSKEQKEFQITLEDNNSWSLIETGKKYLATYSYKDLDDGAKLETIKIPDKAESNNSA